MASSGKSTPDEWNVVSESTYMPESLKSNLLRNPDPSKNSYYVKVNDHNWDYWTKHIEWMWTSKIKDGSFVITIVSHRGCYMLHNGSFVAPAMSQDEEREYKDIMAGEILELCDLRQDELTHDGRLFVVAPEAKATDGYDAERANAFAKYLARVVESNTGLKGKLVTYDPATVNKAVAEEPEYGCVEINFEPEGPEKHDKPQVYINGKLY